MICMVHSLYYSCSLMESTHRGRVDLRFLDLPRWVAERHVTLNDASPGQRSRHLLSTEGPGHRGVNREGTRVLVLQTLPRAVLLCRTKQHKEFKQQIH